MSDLMYNLGHQQTANPELRSERNQGSKQRSHCPMPAPDHTPESDLKRCSKCKELKPCNEFHKSSSTKGGYKSRCKTCIKIESAERYANNPEYWSKYHQDHRAEQLEYKREYWRIHRESQLVRKRERYFANHEEALTRRREYYAAHREEARQRSKQYQREHREEIARKNSERYHSNIERERQKNAERYIANRDDKIRRSREYYAANREKCRARNSQHYARNKHAYILSSVRRRARKRQLPVSFTYKDKLYALEYFGHRCAACGRPRGLWHTLAMDHWIPLTDPRPDNPGTVPWNIVPLCHGIGGCNNSKHNKPPEEWLADCFDVRDAKKINDRVQGFFDGLKGESK